MVYMLPIDGVFADIASVTGKKVVHLVSKGDVLDLTPEIFTPPVVSASPPPIGEGPSQAITSSPQSLQQENPHKTAFLPVPPTVTPNVRIGPRFNFLKSIPTLRIPHTDTYNPVRRRRSPVSPRPSSYLDSPLSQESLFWSALAIWFPGLRRTTITDETRVRLFRLAYRSAFGLYLSLFAEISILGKSSKSTAIQII
jgi:hypothetical protein